VITRILIADDQPEVRSALRLLLEMEADKWTIVGEAQEAQNLIAFINEGECDLVLVDWELPGLRVAGPEGHRCGRLEKVRNIQPGLFVVAMSGRGEARQEALEAGADAFISKGEPPEKLLETLNRLAE
jgi:DNA-binding NarL/FixJ family response regulator